jgi:hypothetical protein
MKRVAIVCLVVAASAAVPIVVMAATGSGGSRIACQSFAFTTNRASTSSNTFAAVPGMHVRAFLAQSYTVQVSGTFSGAPARLRLMDASVGGTFPMRPGVATVRPATGKKQSFSFTWVGSSPSEHQHTFRLQWHRAAAAGTSRMAGGDMTVVFEGAPTPTTC